MEGGSLLKEWTTSKMERAVTKWERMEEVGGYLLDAKSELPVVC
jgi:hypothetical protein